ncbi:MAG: hypothetical protein IJE17_07060, partial [Clostridia bacterium]|nr:hypothetical protein [Clostridia bacterium]
FAGGFLFLKTNPLPRPPQENFLWMIRKGEKTCVPVQQNKFSFHWHSIWQHSRRNNQNDFLGRGLGKPFFGHKEWFPQKI